ncbi:MAG TPA: carboxypeptidase-like regulatory domain-containing protein, partial [Acidobacteriota bacterium]|nr:carboxypeptidase-like regulatory domain-containing protein [Acidobacteriota bacterium]
MIRGGLAKRTWIVFSVIFYLFCPAPGSAQTALSTVRGTVRDQTKAVVPGAEVTVTETGTNLARSVVSDGNGNYEISELKPGTYQLKAELPGFKSVVVEGMRLDSGEIRRFDVLFEIGETTDQVTVEAGAAVITTDSGT